MKTHHEYPARITTDNWLDLLAIQKIDGRSINSLINEGAREVVKKKQIELATYRRVRTTIHTKHINSSEVSFVYLTIRLTTTHKLRRGSLRSPFCLTI